MRFYIWDWVVRLCHLVFICGCAAAYLTYQMNRMDWHAWAGYAVLAAVVVRLIWGVVGAGHARFSQFLRSPAKVWSYLRHWRGQPVPIGHNPLGGYAVMALLATLAVDSGTGLFSDDEIATSGPLRALVSDDSAQVLTHIHRLSFNVLLALIGLHLMAIALYALVKRVNLVSAMITGWSQDRTP